MLADLSNPRTGITSTTFGGDVAFTGLEEFSTVNVSLDGGEGVQVQVRYIKLTFDNFPIVITIPTDETTLIPVGSEIEVVRSGDSNVLIRGEGVSVLPELQSYTSLPDRPTSGFDSGLFFLSLSDDGNILRFFKDLEGFNFEDPANSFPKSVFGDSLPAFELLKASRLRLFNSEDVLLADIANPLRIEGGMGIGFANLVARGEQLVENFYADLRFSTINLEKDVEGQYPASIIVSRIEVITAKNPFPVLPLINSNGNAIPSNGRAKLIKLRENE